MKTLTQNELILTTGGFEPLNDFGGMPAVDSGLQFTLDQLARDQEAAFLRHLMMHQAN